MRMYADVRQIKVDKTISWLVDWLLSLVKCLRTFLSLRFISTLSDNSRVYEFLLYHFRFSSSLTLVHRDEKHAFEGKISIIKRSYLASSNGLFARRRVDRLSRSPSIQIFMICRKCSLCEFFLLPPSIGIVKQHSAFSLFHDSLAGTLPRLKIKRQKTTTRRARFVPSQLGMNSDFFYSSPSAARLGSGS
jgi:hypothetical protein